MAENNIPNEKQNLKERNNFKYWLGGRGESTEKVVSVVVLLVEIALLFWHNVDENVSFYIFTGLNCFFSFFIYITFVDKEWNFFSTVGKKFQLASNYEHPRYKVVRVSEDSLKKKLEKEKENNPGLVDSGIKQDLVIGGEEIKEQLKFYERESSFANKLIEQFCVIKYAWLFTGVLYILFILNHYLFSVPGGSKQYSFLIPVFSAGTIVVSLISAYFFLAAYYVMYYNSIDYTSDVNSNVNKYLHIKKTIWFLGVVLFILISYIFFYNYYKPGNPERINKVELGSKLGNTDYIVLVGEKVNMVRNDAYVIHDLEDQTKYSITPQCNSDLGCDTLDIEVGPTHKKNINIIDMYHKYFYIHSCCNDSIDGKLQITANKPGSKIRAKIDDKVREVKVVFHSGDEKGNVVDFIFQCITGLMSALIMCFFVGRFESMTFQTPVWVLTVLYFYAVIQGFLVMLDVDFLKENDFLLSAHEKISKIVYFIALMGKVVLYIYIQGIFSTKQLFNYFVVTRYQKSENEMSWERQWAHINSEDKYSPLDKK